MSLAHDLNRPDGEPSPLERLDLYLTGLAAAGSERWRARTGQDRAHLTRDLVLLATAGAGGFVLLGGDPVFLLGVAVVACAAGAPGQFRGTLVEQLQLEAAGLPRRTLSYLNVAVLLLGLGGLAAGALAVLLDALLGGSVAPASLRGILGGAALTSLQAARYLARTSPPPPRDPPLRRAWAAYAWAA